MKRLSFLILPLMLVLMTVPPAFAEEAPEGASEEAVQEEILEPTDPVAIIIKGTLPGTSSIEGSPLKQKGLDLAFYQSRNFEPAWDSGKDRKALIEGIEGADSHGLRSTDYGLAAAVWTDDVNRAHRVSRSLRAGVVWVNCYEEGDLTVPFGGVKQSGYGRDKSLDAFDKFLDLKTTWVQLH